MNRSLARALLIAWEHPEFRDGLRHVIDLDEVPGLLAALSTEDGDHEQERRALDLLRAALDSPDVRQAVLLLIDNDHIRRQLTAALAEKLPDRPDLVVALTSALADPAVRAQLRDALETPRLRALLLHAAESGARDRHLSLATQVLVLLARHRTARRLLRSLHHHGVLRALRQ